MSCPGILLTGAVSQLFFRERWWGTAPRKVRGVGESTKQLSRQTLVLGVDAREFPGGLLRLHPAFRMPSLLPHDLCHGRSASLWPPTVNLLSQEHSWLLSRHFCACSYTCNVGAQGAIFFPWGADALWQSTCLRIHQLTLPSP